MRLASGVNVLKLFFINDAETEKTCILVWKHFSGKSTICDLDCSLPKSPKLCSPIVRVVSRDAILKTDVSAFLQKFLEYIGDDI